MADLSYGGMGESVPFGKAIVAFSVFRCDEDGAVFVGKRRVVQHVFSCGGEAGFRPLTVEKAELGFGGVLARPVESLQRNSFEALEPAYSVDGGIGDESPEIGSEPRSRGVVASVPQDFDQLDHDVLHDVVGFVGQIAEALDEEERDDGTVHRVELLPLEVVDHFVAREFVQQRLGGVGYVTHGI